MVDASPGARSHSVHLRDMCLQPISEFWQYCVVVLIAFAAEVDSFASSAELLEVATPGRGADIMPMHLACRGSPQLIVRQSRTCAQYFTKLSEELQF